MAAAAGEEYKVAKVIIGADHGGSALKDDLLEFIKAQGVELEDVGTFEHARCDYPDIAETVCTKVLEGAGKGVVGILVCGTGIGISIAANKVAGIRCALCHDHYTALMSREHNDANVLSLGGRTTGIEVAKEIVKTYLTTPFAGAHHQGRLDKIHAIAKGQAGIAPSE